MIKILALLLVIASPCWSTLPSPSPRPSPSPSAGLPLLKCSAEVTCGDGSKLSCTGEGAYCDCKSGTNDDGYKTVTCDDDPLDSASPNTQTCSTK